MTSLSELTTLHLGGPPRAVRECRDEGELIQTVRELDRTGEPLLVVGGGSNLVVADEGFPGTVVRVLNRGVREREDGDSVLLEVAAGEPWDPLVERVVRKGLAGFECLSGIPGLTGATPIQNVGAYGQEVRESIVRVRVYDRLQDDVADMSAEACRFGYRSSAFKREPGRWVILAVTFRLRRQDQSQPIQYAELARALDVRIGAPAPLEVVREAVLGLRRRKGMVLEAGDPDTVSAGSFFLNPILQPEAADHLVERAAQRLGPDGRPPLFPQPDGTVKTSAAWLIEHSGFHRGYGDPSGIAISSKHTLALTNRGHGTTRELLTLADEIMSGVEELFGVRLHPEPVIVGGSSIGALAEHTSMRPMVG